MTNKNVFIRAHEMTKELIKEKKELNINYQAQFGLCVAFLIEESKESLVDTLKKAAKDAVEELGADEYTCNVWEKGEHKRLYISLKWYKPKYRGIRQEKKCGYVDLIKNEYVTSDRYTKILNLLTGEIQ